MNAIASTATSRQRLGIWLTLAAMLLLVAGLFGGSMLFTLLSKPDLRAELEQRSALYFQTPRAIPEVALVNHHGEAFLSSSFKDQWHLINFGFTFCPDICPTNMMDMTTIYNNLADEGLSDNIQMWMITVDPPRDTPEILAEYVPFFHPEFIGLTGDVTEIRVLAQQLNTVFFQESDDPSYNVAHSDNMAIINPQGEYVALLRPPHNPQQMTEVLSLLMRYSN
ncbi:MAG: SCO family protein [Saccharospirillum sp.]|nr:SCO family protein [Saccharospirillum sp.]